MKSKWFKLGIVTVVVAVLAMLGIGVVTNSVLAQGPQPGGGRPPIGGGPRGGPPIGRPISDTLHSPVAIAAKVFGTSEADLLTALQGGKSIADVAKEKNIALDKVVDAIIADRVADMKANLPKQLSENFTPGQGPGQHDPRGPMGGREHSPVAIAAKVFGMNEADLLTALQGGKTIADVAKEKNITLDKVVDAIIADHATQLKDAVANGHMTQAQADKMLADLKTNLPKQLSEKFPPQGGPQGGRPPFGPPHR